MNRGQLLMKLTGVGKRYESTPENPGNPGNPGSPQTPAASASASRVALAVAGAVLSDVNLELLAGESVSIVGPSGSGKSTLLNIMGGLDRPTEGKVELEGRDLALMKDDELARVRNRSIGFIFQSHHLLPQCTAMENVLVPTLVNGDLDRTRARQRAAQLLERVGLKDRLHHRPGQLSGGERQRVAVVRALVNGPGLLLADEPTGALDSVSSENLSRLLTELNAEEGVTLVVVTHDAKLAGMMGRRLRILDGRLGDWSKDDQGGGGA